MAAMTRRTVVGLGGAAAALALAPAALAAPSRTLSLPPGLQLWTVKADLARDFAGTLRQLRALGYARVEAAGWAGQTPAAFGAAVRAAGLDCVSCHFGMAELIADTDGKLAEAKAAGARYCVASAPALPRAIDPAKPWPVAVAEVMTLADWRRNAEAMNRIGARAKAMGLSFGYHNHPAELLTLDGTFVFAELLRLTDPALVTFELDLGWVAGAGLDPARVLADHAARVALLHVKDIASRERVPGRIVADQRTTPIGAGSIDWKAVFAAAEQAPIKAWFVEQEPPFTESPLTGLRRSLAYLKALEA